MNNPMGFIFKLDSRTVVLGSLPHGHRHFVLHIHCQQESGCAVYVVQIFRAAKRNRVKLGSLHFNISVLCEVERETNHSDFEWRMEA